MDRRSFFKAIAAVAAVAAIPVHFVAKRMRKVWYARNDAEFAHALKNANPHGGDMIVLTPGQTYCAPTGPDTFAYVTSTPDAKEVTYIVSGASDNG